MRGSRTCRRVDSRVGRARSSRAYRRRRLSGVHRGAWIELGIDAGSDADLVEDVIGHLDRYVHVRGVVDHVVGHAHLVRQRRLGGQARADVRLGDSIAVHRADDLQILGHAHHDQRAKTVCSTTLDQQRRLVANERLAALFQGRDAEPKSREDQRVHDVFGELSGLGRLKDVSGELSAIERAFMEDALPEGLDEALKAFRSWSDGLARQFVGVEHGQSTRPPSVSDGRLARADSTSESKDETGHFAKRTPSRGRRESPRIGCLAERAQKMLPWPTQTGPAIPGPRMPPPARTPRSRRSIALGVVRLGLVLSGLATLTAQPALAEVRCSSGHLEPVWRAGSSLVQLSPHQGLGGWVVASAHGTVESLREDAALRFSVNLGGASAGEGYSDEAGKLFFPTWRGQILALSRDGARLWVYKAPRGVRSKITFLDRFGLLFVGDDGALWGIHRGGGLTLHALPRSPITAGPVLWGGWLVVATARGELEFFTRAGGHRTFALPGGTPSQQLVPLGDGSLVVRQSGDFTRLVDPQRPVATGSGQGLQLAGYGAGLVTLTRERLEFWSYADLAKSPSQPGQAYALSASMTDGDAALDLRMLQTDGGDCWLARGGRLWRVENSALGARDGLSEGRPVISVDCSWSSDELVGISRAANDGSHWIGLRSGAVYRWWANAGAASE